jgi:hypothetical protein
MTDTQAASAGTARDSGTGGGEMAENGGAGDSAAAGSGAGATAAGKDGAKSGRASVPGADSGGGNSSGGSASSKGFTRAPGMQPPPESLTVPAQSPNVSATAGRASVSAPPATGLPATVSGPSGTATGSASVARASVRVPGGATTTSASSAPSATSTIGVRIPPSEPSEDGSSGPGATGAARVSEAVRAARKTVSAAVGRGPRRARLHVKRIDPWSVMKFSFAVSFVLFVVVIVATSVLYLALDAMGVFESVNKTLSDMIGATGGGGDSDTFKITAKGVIGGAALLGLVNVVLFTALATLGAFIYNVCADLVGGIELTLAEKD